MTSSGCAATYSKAQYFSVGEFNPKANEDVEKSYRQLQESPPPEAAQVRVLFESTPEGIKAENGNISVEKGYPVRIVGKFTLGQPRATPLWFADYKSNGRKALCYWQVPLTWVTLGLWAVLMPTAYPCYAAGFKTQDEWIDHIRLLAYAAHGNLVVAMRGAGGAAQGFIFDADPAYIQAVLDKGPGKGTSPRDKKPSDLAKKAGPGPDV